MNKNTIILRPRMWFGNFAVGIFFFFLILIWSINNVIEKLNMINDIRISVGDLVLDVILFILLEGVFLFMILYYSAVIKIDGDAIEICYLFILKKKVSLKQIDYLEVKGQKNRYRRYDEISFYIDGKKLKLINSPSELWNNYDELISFAYQNNVSIKRV